MRHLILRTKLNRCHPLIIHLQLLKAPKAFNLTRKHKVDCNPPPEGKRRVRRQGSSEPKTVTVFTQLSAAAFFVFNRLKGGGVYLRAALIRGWRLNIVQYV